MFECLFAFNGGSGRLHLLGNIFFWLLMLAGAALLWYILIDKPAIGLGAIWVIIAVSFFSLWAVTTRRIHDIGQSGWWAIFVTAFLYFPIIGLTIYNYLQNGLIFSEMQKNSGLMLDNSALFAIGCVIITTLVSVVIFLVLLAVPGKHEDNPYILE